MNSMLFYLLLISICFALTVVLLSSLSIKYPRIGFYLRLSLSWVSLVLCACYGVIASLVLRIVGYGGLSQWTVARCFKWTMYYTTGIEFVVQNEEYLSARPAVFIGNHQTSVALHRCLGVELLPSDLEPC